MRASFAPEGGRHPGDVIGHFDLSPRGEIRASLSELEGRPYVELRVCLESATGERELLHGQDGIKVPLDLFGKYCRALHAVSEALRRRDLLPLEPPGITQMVGGELTVVSGPRAPAPIFGRCEVGHLKRSPGRIPLDCPVEYRVRGGLREARNPERRRGRTKDISRAGAQVVLPERISVLTVLLVTVDLPVGVISLPCEVVWAELSRAKPIAGESYRHGLRFIEVGPQERWTLGRLLEPIVG